MKIVQLKYCFFTLSIFLIVSTFASAATIKLVADEWPPYNTKPKTYCKNTDTKKLCEGYMVDIAREVFEKHGYTVEYYIMPWKRAMQEVMNGNLQGLIGADYNDGKGFVFPETEMAINTLSFYVKKGNPWRFDGESSMKQVSLGTIKGYGYREWLYNYIQNHKEDYNLVQEVTGNAALKTNLKKLVHGRVDVIVDSEATIRYEAMQMGYLGEIEPAGYGTLENKIYIVFSPQDSRSEIDAKILSAGIKELRENGRLAEILNRYGLTDWEK
ncbi:MAG: transporter substrate-binding domain-containing protein [Desulfobacterales bacterium]|nr:transporter substrate-binding domain-containing protein [Desulfobacterales bacterium]